MSSSEWDSRYRADERVRAWSATPNRLLVAEAAELPPGRALDLACGLGRNAIWLAERGWAVTGVDFSEVAVAEAGRRAADRGVELELVLADVARYAPSARAYDLVLVLYLQLPRPELRAALDRAAEAVAAGGTFLLVGHDLENLEHGVGGPDNPEVLYTPEDVVAAIGDLEIDRAERVTRDVPGEARRAIDCFVRARRPAPA